MSKSAIFHLEGGVGKHVAFTGVINAYKQQYPDEEIIIVSAWPEVFLNNPKVDRVYKIGNTPHFYKDFIYKKDIKIYAQEPYKQTSHIKKEKNLIETWCDLVECDYKNTKPELFFNYREMEVAKSYIPQSDKPLAIIQPFGGPGKESQQYNYSWMRDVHPNIAQQMVNILSQSYNVIYICYDFHPHLDNCHRLDAILPKKILFSLLNYSQKRILIDSSLQHAAAAMNIPSTVLWIATQPEIFGYDIHNNIKPKLEFPEGTVDSYLYDYNFTGQVYECPFSNADDIFDFEAISKDLEL